MIKPYYEEPDITIYHGDCRDILPHLGSVDLVLTDPPYGIGKMVSGTMSNARLHKTKYASFIDSEDYVKSVCIPAIEKCLMISKRMILTPGSRCLKFYPQWDSFGVFYAPANVSMQRWGSGDCWPILYYGKPYDIGKKIHKCSYVLTEPPSSKFHPCAKPIKIWKKILETRSQTTDIILDPFMGSGTTLRAAKDLGRKAIGIEIEEKYCEIAVRRLRQEVLPLK